MTCSLARPCVTDGAEHSGLPEPGQDAVQETDATESHSLLYRDGTVPVPVSTQYIAHRVLRLFTLHLQET